MTEDKTSDHLDLLFDTRQPLYVELVDGRTRENIESDTSARYRLRKAMPLLDTLRRAGLIGAVRINAHHGPTGNLSFQVLPRGYGLRSRSLQLVAQVLPTGVAVGTPFRPAPLLHLAVDYIPSTVDIHISGEEGGRQHINPALMWSGLAEILMPYHWSRTQRDYGLDINLDELSINTPSTGLNSDMTLTLTGLVSKRTRVTIDAAGNVRSVLHWDGGRWAGATNPTVQQETLAKVQEDFHFLLTKVWPQHLKIVASEIATHTGIKSDAPYEAQTDVSRCSVTEEEENFSPVA